MSSIGWHHFAPTAWMIPGGNSARRRELNAEKELPTLSEIQARLGIPLAHVFFQSMTDTTAKDQIGLAPPLKGPQEELWVSPTDILQCRSVLTEPNSAHCRQALTHQSILNIGAGYENAVQIEMKKKIKMAILEAEKKIKKQKEEEIDLAIQKTRADEHDRYEILLKIYQRQADDFVQKSIAKVRETLIAEANVQKEEALRLLRVDMEKQMLDAIKEREQYIEKKFNFKLSWEINKCYENYENKIIQQQKKWAKIFEAAKTIFQNELDNIGIELEAKHMIDIVRIYGETQLEINKDKEAMEKTVQNCFEINAKNIKEKHNVIAQKDIEIKEQEFKIHLLKDRLNDLAVQFQRFIKFILQQQPGQGEYLLSLEEIMKDTSHKAFGDEKEKNLLTKMSPECNPEIVQMVMALIIETLLKRSEIKGTGDEEITRILGKNIIEETFEEQVQQERERKRAINFVSIKTNSNDETDDNHYLEKKLAAVKDVFTRNPSFTKLFLATGTSSAQGKFRSFQNQNSKKLH